MLPCLMVNDDEIMWAANTIVNVLYVDSGITLNLIEIFEILKGDITVLKSVVPSTKDIETLVMGDDEGSIPEELTKRYPDTSSFLEQQF